MKILHVVGRMDRGGTEALLMNLLHTVDKDRYQFDFVEQTQDECNYDQEILSLGSKIYRCPHISLGSLREYRKWWREFFARHPEYRIVHGHSRGSAPVYLDEAKKAGRVTILHCHSNSHGKGTKGLIRYIWQLPLRKLADYNFACSFGAGVSQFGKNNKFTVIKNGIRTDRFVWNPEIRAQVRKKFGIENSLVVGNVSRFEEPKNHVFLVEIFACIQKKIPNAILMLVGQGSLEWQIRQKADALGVLDHILFTGIRSDVNEMLQAMDVFVFPSLYEGMPLSLVEAQTSGVPCFVSARVISSEVDLTDLIHHIPLEELPEVWAKQILAGVIPVEERRDRSGEIVASGFDVRSTCKQLCEFYEGVWKDEQ